MKLLTLAMALVFAVSLAAPASACFGPRHKEKKIAKLERKLAKKEAKFGSAR